ncbi:hypothetical protein Q5752_000851 [Cryptotrichosporon argae]
MSTTDKVSCDEQPRASYRARRQARLEVLIDLDERFADPKIASAKRELLVLRASPLDDGSSVKNEQTSGHPLDTPTGDVSMTVVGEVDDLDDDEMRPFFVGLSFYVDQRRPNRALLLSELKTTAATVCASYVEATHVLIHDYAQYTRQWGPLVTGITDMGVWCLHAR